MEERTVTLRIPASLHQQMKVEAAERGIKLQDIVLERLETAPASLVERYRINPCYCCDPMAIFDMAKEDGITPNQWWENHLNETCTHDDALGKLHGDVRQRVEIELADLSTAALTLAVDLAAPRGV